VDQAHEIKKRVEKIPVSVVGRLVDPVMCDRVIREGKTDLVCMGRALLADPQLPKRAETGNLDDIRPCISCSRCIDSLMRGLEVRCTVNPVLGKEEQSWVQPAERPKTIVVIGGGPAGMEAAITAARRGHRVTLIEKEENLGGKARVAAIPPSRQMISRFLNYQEAQLKRAGVEVKTGQEATGDMINAIEADEVVIAAGARPIRPDIPGIHLAHVFPAEDILNGKAQAGERIVIIGGGIVGLETAEHLAEAGKRVVVLEMTDVICRNEEDMTKKLLLVRVNELGVRIFINCRVKYITRDSVILDPDGVREPVPADTVVLAAGYVPDRGLLHDLDLGRQRVHVVGDSKEARDILEAVEESFWLGRNL